MTAHSAREEILRAVRAARPPAVPAPQARSPVPRAEEWKGDLFAEFAHTASAAGAAVIPCSGDELAGALRDSSASSLRILSRLVALDSTVRPETDLRWAASLDLYACAASLGVAENGAVWIATDDALSRAALFLATRVIITVARERIVPDLHDAYALIDVRAHAFGVFVAGPSKTADIEQSLVIGAHGPKELTLLVTGR